MHERPQPLPDVIAPGLRVLFCGINPGLRSAATGHHFAGRGNRFWAGLYGAGFTPRLLRADEDRELLRHGLGITNLVDRPTATASELSSAELRNGAAALAALTAEWSPQVVAVVGLGAWRTAFGRRDATCGLQPDRIAGVPAWLLPNPSGLNAHHQLPELVELFSDLRRWLAHPAR